MRIFLKVEVEEYQHNRQDCNIKVRSCIKLDLFKFKIIYESFFISECTYKYSLLDFT